MLHSTHRNRSLLLSALAVGLLSLPSAAWAQDAGFGAAEEPSTFDKMKAAFTNPFKKDPAKEAAAKAERDSQLQRKNDPTSLSYEHAKPLNADFYVALARNQERAGNIKSADSNYRRALELDPNNFDALLDYARLLDRQGNLPGALGYYARASARRPKDSAVLNDMALCHARQGQFDEAIARLNQAIRQAPDRKRYRNNLATILVEVDRVDQAYEQLAAVHPPAVAHYNLGYLLSQANQTDAAIQQFELSLRANPDFDPARQWLDYLAGGAASNVEPDVRSAPIARQPTVRSEAPTHQEVDVTQPWAAPGRSPVREEPTDDQAEGPALEDAAYEFPNHWQQPPALPQPSMAPAGAMQPGPQRVARTSRTPVVEPEAAEEPQDAEPQDAEPPTPDAIDDYNTLRFGGKSPGAVEEDRYYPPSRY